MSEPVNFYSNNNIYEVEDYALVFGPARKVVKESKGTVIGVVNSPKENQESVSSLEIVDISGAFL